MLSVCSPYGFKWIFSQVSLPFVSIVSSFMLCISRNIPLLVAIGAHHTHPYREVRRKATEITALSSKQFSYCCVQFSFSMWFNKVS
jgi:hypothetical protein